jgi:glucan-binding YG repeat protein
MTKQTKLVATLSAAALLALGMSAVSFAAGWDNSTGEWQWLDNDGNAVTDTWKSANGNWFYLGSDGNMVTDSLIEDTKESKTRYYYVDQYGAMVTNTWKAVAMDGDYNTDLDAEYWWYYFGSDGKAYTTDSDKDLSKTRIKTINGLKYAFDEEGHMLYGWIDKTTKDQQDDNKQAWMTSDYYFNGWNDGHMATGWQKLSVENSDGDEKNYWFYFGSDGVKVKDKSKKINGKKYYFTSDGNMRDEWSDGTESINANTTAGTLKYLNGDGSERKNKWVWAVPDEDYALTGTDYDDDEYSWWYYGKNGVLYSDAVKKINGKKYAFDAAGRMLKGFATANTSDEKSVAKVSDWDKKSRDEWFTVSVPAGKSLYYFSNDKEKDGSMKKGYQSVELDDGTYQFYFDTKNGKAKTEWNSKIKKFTINGLVLQPTNDDDSNYMGVVADQYTNYKTAVPSDVTFNANELAGKYLVSKNGTVVTGKTKLKDSEDHYYVVSKNGVVDQYFDSEDSYNDFMTVDVTVTSGTTTKQVEKKASIDFDSNGDAHYYYVQGANETSATWKYSKGQPTLDNKKA